MSKTIYWFSKKRIFHNIPPRKKFSSSFQNYLLSYYNYPLNIGIYQPLN
nr:MAG TPA: hypothetical protein [Caudoviricetes sp.]